MVNHTAEDEFTFIDYCKYTHRYSLWSHFYEEDTDNYIITDITPDLFGEP